MDKPVEDGHVIITLNDGSHEKYEFCNIKGHYHNKDGWWILFQDRKFFYPWSNIREVEIKYNSKAYLAELEKYREEHPPEPAVPMTVTGRFQTPPPMQTFPPRVRENHIARLTRENQLQAERIMEQDKYIERIQQFGLGELSNRLRLQNRQLQDEIDLLEATISQLSRLRPGITWRNDQATPRRWPV